MGDSNYGQTCFRPFPKCAENTGYTGTFGTQEKKPRRDLPIIDIPRVCSGCMSQNHFGDGVESFSSRAKRGSVEG